MKIKFSLFILFLFSLSLACNDDDEAPIIFNIKSIDFVFQFPPSVNESSGLTLLDGQIITHNDRGDGPNLYAVDLENGTLNDTYPLTDLTHSDWEAIAQYEEHLYIGDFGNNAGARQDLQIFEINKTDFSLSRTIPFSYTNQIDFTLGYGNHNFNMEAMIAMKDELYLFSKNHLNQKTDLYQMSRNNETSQGLTPIDSLDALGLISDAAYDADSKLLALVGYESPMQWNTFLWLIPNFEGTFQNTNPQRFPIQIEEKVEGVTFLNASTLLVSSECINGEGCSLHQINIE